MHPPANENGGPRATGNRRNEPNAHQTQVRAATVQTELPVRHPVAHVSLYAPHAGRRTWWFAYRCPHCSYGHRGELRQATDEETAEKAVIGVRRSRCGKRLWLVVARVYRGNEGMAA
ncbi:hypothetical protein ACIBQX_32905 [Nonomuraea sp. NPDC049714]|uniref:hypothetical protein n=1 Tax=Nonomuraea sp. NPDC049714 TaxID=3364357 RepID=UPI0037B7A399